MEVLDLKQKLEENYNISVKSLFKIKNVYKIESDKKCFCFKVIKYNFGHFLFIINAMMHLQKNGFERIPRFYLTKNKSFYIKIENNYGYLTEWINGRECNYSDNEDLKLAVLKLADLHNKSCNFKVERNMNPRIGWLRWIEIFETRRDEILDFKNRMDKKVVKSEFDYKYREIMEEEIIRAERAIANLKRSSYVNNMKSSILKREFCHHDYAHHNLLLTEDKKMYIIDFDYCILDTHLHDLSSIIIRTMKNGNWSLNKAEKMISWYNSMNLVLLEDLPIMAAFIEFPQAYWQLGIQYYWEKRPWNLSVFLDKLDKISMDREARQEFVEKLINLKSGD
ncbi:CotS family spore coat protein [Haloimpatiens sp. FM7315]|uniref:CotS family spore coat protein n=1 Tax=Haloimpatiens sp. FM7315 TaxID=3298609 RepID=UPI0035A32F2B